LAVLGCSCLVHGDGCGSHTYHGGTFSDLARHPLSLLCLFCMHTFNTTIPRFHFWRHRTSRHARALGGGVKRRHSDAAYMRSLRWNSRLHSNLRHSSDHLISSLSKHRDITPLLRAARACAIFSTCNCCYWLCAVALVLSTRTRLTRSGIVRATGARSRDALHIASLSAQHQQRLCQHDACW